MGFLASQQKLVRGDINISWIDDKTFHCTKLRRKSRRILHQSIHAMTRLFSFEGRMRRKTYWISAILAPVIAIVLMFVLGLILRDRSDLALGLMIVGIGLLT